MKMKRSELYPMPAYFDKYILLADDIDMLEALQISLHELENIPLDLWKSLGNVVYAQGKWTIKDLMQHMIDTERIFSYRAVSFARGDKQVPPYDEDEFAKCACQWANFRCFNCRSDCIKKIYYPFVSILYRWHVSKIGQWIQRWIFCKCHWVYPCRSSTLAFQSNRRKVFAFVESIIFQSINSIKENLQFVRTKGW